MLYKTARADDTVWPWDSSPLSISDFFAVSLSSLSCDKIRKIIRLHEESKSIQVCRIASGNATDDKIILCM